MDVNVSWVILHCTMGKSDEQGSEIFFFLSQITQPSNG